MLTQRQENNFFNKVRLDDSGCWLWTGCKTNKGYGKLGLGRGATKLAHRVSYEFFIKPIPKGKCALHKCDTPLCVNPSHIFIGTQEDNMNDMARKGRARSQNSDRTHCHRGHEFTSENTEKWTNKINGSVHRTCRICRRVSRKAHRLRSKQG